MSTDTIRERALEALRTAVEDMSEEVDGVKFSIVSREQLDAHIKGRRAACGVYDETERKQVRVSVEQCQLAVYLEFHVLRDKDVRVRTLVGRYMQALQVMVRRDRTLGGLITDLKEVENSVEDRGIYDNYAQGVMRLELQYRHHLDDPTRRA